MSTHRAVQRYVQSLAAMIGEPVLVFLRAKPQIKRPQSSIVGCFFNQLRQQTKTGRILFQIAVESRLVPKPGVVKVEPVVPGKRLLPGKQAAKNEPSRLREQLRQLCQNDSAFGPRHVADA